jgi:transposase-like protein
MIRDAFMTVRRRSSPSQTAWHRARLRRMGEEEDGRIPSRTVWFWIAALAGACHAPAPNAPTAMAPAAVTSAAVTPATTAEAVTRREKRSAPRQAPRMDGAELKRELAKAQAGGRGRYPAVLREAVLDYASRAKRQGKSHAKVAAELGMSVQTLQYWRANAHRRPGLTPVTIVAERVPERELVIECGPLRVRGLDLASVAELLKRLL